MNAQPASASPHDVAANPPAGLRVDTIAIADLVFGYSSTDGSDSTRPRPLALLPNAALELDLTDPEQREFGDYELLELIGEGGMGVVYRAYQKTLDREVAVKLLAAGPWASKPYVERFRREAQNAARMQHPNIVAIYEVASAEELHFFSMRLVRGPSLAVVLKRDGPLPPRKAASLMRTIAEAVDYAHRLGVLHLDLKPGNVLIDETGTAHVADFGLARRLDPIDGTGIEADAEEISGTPSYMAPEQANMQKLSPAADVWGLGAVLYELLTGRPPFLGDTPKDTLRLVRETRPAPPRQLAPAAPRDLEAITLACLQHDPAQRYPSARELADDLGRFIEGRAVKARPLNAAQRSLRWARREQRLALATLLAFLALGVGMLATTQQWQRADANAQLAAQNAALVSERLWQTRIDQAETALRAGHAFNALPSLAANIAEREHEGKDASVDRLRYANVLRSAPQLIDAIGTNAPLTHAALSDDGRFVATTTSTGLKGTVQLYDLATGVRRWETDTFDSRRPENSVTPRNLHFTADRRFLIVSTEWLAAVAVQPSGVAEYLLDAGTGQILQPPQDRYPNLDYATYSPDAEYALVHTLNGRQAQILRSSDWTVVSPLVPLKGFDPNWLVAPHGAHVAATRNGFTDLVLLDPRTLRERQHFAAPETQRLTAWAFSPDARELLIGRSNGSLERIAMADGKRTAVVPAPLGRIGRVAYSADGRWFGAVAESGEVMVWEATGATLVAPVARFEGLPPDFGGYRLELDPASRLVLAARGSHNGLWRLIARDQPPKQLASELPGGHSITLDAKRGILAGGRLPASLYLWRLQPEAMRASSLAPLQQKEFPAADRIAGVDGAAVQIVASRDGRAQGPRIALPQAPSFATLTADGARTVIVVGHELRVHDAQSGQPSITPLMLANDPQHVVIAPDSRHLFASYGDYADSRYVEIAQSFDLVSGKALSAPTPLPGQIDDVFFSADGATVGVGRYDEIRLLNADTLTPRFPPKVLGQGANALLDHYYEHELDTVGPRNFDAPGLGNAAISADGRWLDVILNTNPDTGELLRLDAHSGEQ
ncbi:serine/threonine-protein kinase, partial [Rudaea sp.]|uniref:WD40 repeat domain-containing serine/threonine protein kinase n=1 Tax=Rudaea sp. TaxID=2136325 RepID=UPI002ED2F2F7